MSQRIKKCIKMLASTVSLVLLLCILPLDAVVNAETVGNWEDYKADNFSNGSGTESDPYQIATAEQLAYFAGNLSDGYYVLTANIDLSAHQWNPAGSFSGTLDGNGKTITGLKIGNINAPANYSNKNVGLFESIASGGKVCNLTVDVSIYISDAGGENKGVAGMAGQMHGTLDNCKVMGTIDVTRSPAFVGGLAGYFGYNGKIINCANEATIVGSGSNVRIGGIAGYAVIGASHNGDILLANSYNTGSVTAKSSSNVFVGGICGYIQNGSNIEAGGRFLSIYNCYNSGTLTKENCPNTTTGHIGGGIYIYNKGVFNANYLYGVSTLNDGNKYTVTVIDNMTAESFVNTLNTNANALANAGITGLLKWNAVENGTPCFDGTRITEKWTHHAATAFAGGTGTEENPYQIATAAQLAFFSTNVTNGHYVLTENIDLAEYEWVPARSFGGTFDGNGKTISGLKIGTQEEPADFTNKNVGLFDSVALGGIVKNLTVDAAIYVSDAGGNNKGVAGIAGLLYGTLDACTVKGTINVARSPAYVGGLAGYFGYNGVIVNCANEATIVGSGSNVRIGGISGYAVIGASHDGDILLANSYNTGSVTAKNSSNVFVGGICGYIQNGSNLEAGGKTLSIYNCYNSGTLAKQNCPNTTTGHIGGGIYIYNKGVLNANYLYGETVVDDGNRYTVTVIDDLTSEAFVETLNTNANALANSGLSGLLKWTAGENGMPGFDGTRITEKWSNHTAIAFAGGTGTEDDPYQIATAAQLAFFATNVSNGYYKLTEDIDLAEYEWVPAGNLNGTFDGNGKTISGLFIGNSEEAADFTGKNVGLFSSVSANGLVKNLTVDVSIYINDEGGTNVGAAGIAGVLYGTLEHCTIKGTVNCTRPLAHVGGMAGHFGINGKIINCVNEATVIGSGKTLRLGGLVGYAVIGQSHEGQDVIIANSYNIGGVVAQSSSGVYAGGICGYVENASKIGKCISIYNCYNAGTVSHQDCKSVWLGHVIGERYIYNDGVFQSNFLYGRSMLNDSDCGGFTVVDDMSVGYFAETLTNNADALVGEGKCTGLFAWEQTDNGSPVFANTTVTGTMAIFEISVNSFRLGSVTVKVDEAGGTNFADTTKTILKKGSRIQLTFLPATGCRIMSVKLNGVPQAVTGSTFEFEFTASTSVEVEFEVENIVPVDPIYVNPNVLLSGDGTEDSPFRTLDEAKQKLRQVLASQKNADITIYLMDGTYRLSETLLLSDMDTSLGHVRFKNYENAVPVLTSGQLIAPGSFTEVAGKEYYRYQLPNSAKIGQNWPQFRDLLINGERATLARSETYKFVYSYANSIYNDAKVTSCENILYVSAAALAEISNANLSGVEISTLVEWKSQIFHIGSITGNLLGNEVEITLDSTEWGNFYAFDTNKKSLVGRGYWLQNHINFLDEPGEFYYDQDNGIVYYYPYADQNMATAQIEYAVLDTLITIENAANITFDGIVFTGTTANYITENGLVGQLGGTALVGDEAQNVPCAAIYGNWAEGIRIQNCFFEQLGGSSVVFDYGTKDIQIIGNSIRNIGMVGISLGQRELSWGNGASEDVVICNNYITNIGLQMPCSPAISVTRVEDLIIQHNTIVHVPYSGISVGSGFTYGVFRNITNAEISYNYIEDFLYSINDGGAIYVCGANANIANTEFFNSIHHNYIRAGAHNQTYTGIYHDGSASNWHTYSNVIDDVKSKIGPMFFQDNVRNQFTHNINAENNFTTCAPITQSGEKDKDGNLRNIVLLNNELVSNRSQFNAEAAAIVNGAGLQTAFSYLEKPMDAEVRIKDSSMHYEVSLKQEGNTSMQIEVSNHSGTDKTYIFAVTDNLPNGITLVINGGNLVSVEAGETVTVEAEYIITDSDKVLDTEDYVVGLSVTDAYGRTEQYPRFFTIRTLSGNTAYEIPYGTPVVDGVLDEVYRNGVMNFFGPVFHPDTNHQTDISGGYYLLWDENYLYCYVIVNESTIMSRGTDWIQSAIMAGNQGNLWETDAVEVYVKVPSIRNGVSKFAVDAFGVQRFGNAGISLSHHNSLPYATKFTYEGEILDYTVPETIMAGQTASSAIGEAVTGYVIEMTLPITLVESIINSADGVPSAGDTIEFYLQNNDYRGFKDDGISIYTVAQANVQTAYTLQAPIDE